MTATNNNLRYDCDLDNSFSHCPINLKFVHHSVSDPSHSLSVTVIFLLLYIVLYFLTFVQDV